MATRIRVLDPVMVNQIAAGEVIERAASVVKELAENSLDAGASKIDVELVGGGRTLIRVVDDGCGMSAEDARLSIERHATSKLVHADDLWGLTTFGFRGEALPSIAAVSKFSLATRTADRDEGIQIDIEGGRFLREQALGMAPGTRIEVRELFFNTPARLKFQKTEVTEAANASEALLKLALANPGVHVRLRSNGRVALDLPPHRDLGERVRAALARRGGGVLHEALGREPLPKGQVAIRAFLGAPEDASTTTRSTFIFVGRRCVRDRQLLQALCMGYGELLERGRYPLAALFIDAPAEEVDVNVHPQKLEVRFASAQRIHAAVRHVVREAIARAPWLREPPSGPLREPARESLFEPTRGHVGESAHAPQGTRSRTLPGTRSFSLPPAPRARDSAFGLQGQGPWESAPRASLAGPTIQVARGEPALRAPHEPGHFSGLRYLGQLDRTYLVCEGQSELVLIDSRAAGECVAFERLRVALRTRTIARRSLLFPVPIEVDPGLGVELPALLAPGALLQTLGFEAEPFGTRTLLLRAVPELVANADPKPLVLDVLARVLEVGVDVGSDRAATEHEHKVEHVLWALACHAVAHDKDVLSPEEVRGLLEGLDEVDLGATFLHGRTVVVRISVAELARRFGRP